MGGDRGEKRKKLPPDGGDQGVKDNELISLTNIIAYINIASFIK
jgi:hypothetical protein